VGTPLPAAFIREIETQLGWIAQLPWPAGIIDRQTINSLRLIPAIRRLNLVDSVGKLHARDEADGIMPPWRKRSITVRSISDDCCYMMAASTSGEVGLGVEALAAGWRRLPAPQRSIDCPPSAQSAHRSTPNAFAPDLVQSDQRPVGPARHLGDGLTVDLRLAAEHLSRRNSK
jgi:hypothetical protein